MLKLTLKPGEYLQIGDEIRVIFSGGSANNIHLLVDAPREIGIERKKGERSPYYGEKKLSPQAQREIIRIIGIDKDRAKKQGEDA